MQITIKNRIFIIWEEGVHAKFHTLPKELTLALVEKQP